MTDQTPTSYPCRECQIGTLRPRQVSYFIRQGRQLVSVPDFPAWVCDFCGNREYDTGALAELNAMLENNRRTLRPPRRPRPKPDPEQPRPPADPRRRP